MHRQGPKPDCKSTKPKQSSVSLRALCGEPVEPWIPESKLPQVPLNPTNSFVRKILLTTPAFPRFYADIVLATRPNSREAKILRPLSRNFREGKCHVQRSRLLSYQGHRSPLQLPRSPRRAILLLPPERPPRRPSPSTIA